MCTARFRPLQALCAAGLLSHALAPPTACAQTDPLWISGAQTITFPAPGGTAITTAALPTSFLPNVADAFEYQGAIAGVAQNVQADGTGAVLFSVVDGRVYNGDGLLIADRFDDPACEVCMLPGGPRVFIAPIRGSCERYLVMAPQVDTDRDQEYTINVRFGILDMSLVNDHPYYAANNLTVMGRFLSINDNALLDDFDYWDPQVGGMSITWVNGNTQAYLADWTLPYSLTGHPDVVRIDAAALAGGDQLVGLESAAALNFLLNTDRGPYYVDGFGKTQPESDWHAERSVRGELELHTSGTQLLVAYSGYKRAGGSPDIHTLAVVHSAFDLNGLPGALPMITGQGYPRIYEVEHYTDGTGLAQQDHFGNPIVHPRVCGLEFSPNGDQIYFLKSSYHVPPHTNFGVIDRNLLPPNGVSPLAIGAYTETRKLADSELELNVDATGTDPVLYAIGTSGVGQYWLGAFADPDVPDPANWQPNAVPLATPATYGGINAVQYRLLNGRIRGDEHILTLAGGCCCMAAQMAQSEPALYAFGGSNTSTSAWQPGQSPFLGSPAEVILDQDFIVQTGAQLYVKNMTWRFAQGAKLIVEPGARAYFDHCTLTSYACAGQRWDGVEVHGVPADPAAAASQGRITFTNGCEISNAVIGVLCSRMAQGSFDFSKNGGAVRAYNSIFRNNQVGTALMLYLPSGNLQSLCRFTACDFVTDSDWPDLVASPPPPVPLPCKPWPYWPASTPQRHALLFGVNDVAFNNCRFSNDAPGLFPIGQRGFGVQSFLAGYTIQGTDPALHWMKNLDLGVYASGAHPALVYTVQRMGFQNNWYGILDQATLNPVLHANDFSTLAEGYVYPSVGLFLFQTEGYSVERNFFSAPGGTPTPGIGTYFYGPTEQDNRIYYNEFHDLFGGSIVEGVHRVPGSVTQASIGLQLLCGDHYDNVLDQAVLYNGLIRRAQGDNFQGATGLANNTYNRVSPCQSGWEVWVDPLEPLCNGQNFCVDYYYFDNPQDNPEMRPECVDLSHVDDVYDLIPWDPNGAPFDKETYCPDVEPLPGGGSVQVALDNYQEAVAQLGSAVNTYNGTVDGGEMPDLIEAIEHAAPWHASYALRDLLLASHPLSDEVMKTALYRDEPMDPWHLTQVLIDNSPQEEGLLLQVHESSRLNAFFLALLDEAQTGELSTRKVLELEVGHRQERKDRMRHRLLVAWASDTVQVNPSDSLVSWLGADSLGTGARDLYRYHVIKGETEAADGLVGALENQNSYTGLLMLGALSLDLNGNWFAADEGKRDQLRDLAFGTEQVAQGEAWGILQLIGTTDSLPTALLPSGHRGPATVRLPSRPIADTELTAYPNPSTGTTWITLPVGFPGGLLQVIDTQGKLIHQQVASKAVMELDLGTANTGLYLIRLLFEGMPVAETKLSLAR